MKRTHSLARVVCFKFVNKIRIFKSENTKKMSHLCETNDARIFAIPKRSPIRAKLGARALRNILVPFAKFQSDARRNEGAVIDPIKCSYCTSLFFFFLVYSLLDKIFLTLTTTDDVRANDPRIIVFRASVLRESETAVVVSRL